MLRELIAKYLSREFILIVVCCLFAYSVLKGWLTPEKVIVAADNIQKTTESIPALIEAIKNLIGNLAPIGGLFGLTWAYLKRRSDQKITLMEANLELKKQQLEIEKKKVP